MVSDEAAALDAAVARISTQLVAASGDELLEVIRTAMAELGGVFDVDHAYVALLDVEPGGSESPLVLEWLAPDVPPPSDIFESFTPTEQRWWLDRLLSEGSFVLQSIDQPGIGADAAARLSHLGVRSLVLVPILVGGRLHGHLGLSTVRRERSFSPHLVGMLRVLGEACINAVERDRAASALLEATAELERRNAELERSNRDLEAFAYVASHDLKSPLFVVQGFLDLLSRTKFHQLDDEAHTFVDAALRGARRMNALIDDLLAYSRAGRAPGTSVSVDLGRVVDRVIAELEPTRRETGGEVRRGDLPIVAGDEIQLGQVFQNLISNGLKFVAPDVEPDVVIEAEPEPDAIAMWRISITDNGIGVPADERDRVFAMFTRLHGQDEFPGTGIGLAICQRVIEAHGGRIWVEEGPGGTGSRFVFTLRAERRRSHRPTGAAAVTADRRPASPSERRGSP